jgi:ABC-type Fe3+/spermidine/putrescine transport system ATPase subunit
LPAQGTRVELAVRPEKFTLLQGRVLQPIYLGASITYRVEVSNREFAVFHQNKESRPYKQGQPVWLTWSAAHSTVLEST